VLLPAFHAALGGTEHELRVPVVDRVLIDVKAIHVGCDRGSVGHQVPPTIDDLEDRDFVAAFE
jgi:hypothetical protein